MLLFAHTGITLGAGLLLRGLMDRRITGEETQQRQSRLATLEPDDQNSTGVPSVGLMLRCVDLRILLIGSLLPDIVDKPIGQFFFLDTFNNGRIFGHTILFLVAISLIGYYLYMRRQKFWLLVVSFGSGMHLVLDQMWRNTHTLLWPAYGFTFEKADLSDWLPGLIKALHTNPAVYVPELFGLIIMEWFTWSLVSKGRCIHFLKFGRV